jgi:hypothetical protein
MNTDHKWRWQYIHIGYRHYAAIYLRRVKFLVCT